MDLKSIKSQNVNKQGPQTKVIAKAVIRDRIRNTYHAVVVFESSSYDEFYWIFKLKHARSPRRDWVYVWRYRRELKSGAGVAYCDFDTFIAYYCRAGNMELIRDTQKAKRRVRGMLSKARGDSTLSQITYDHAGIDPRRVRLVNRKFAKKINKRSIDWYL